MTLRLKSLVGKTVDESVRRQAEIGIDVVSDGEVGKPGFVNYVRERLGGFGGVGAPWGLDDMDELPELLGARYGGAAGQHIMMPECIGPVSYVGQDKVKEDIARLRHALQKSRALEGFIPATSPGCVTMSREQTFAELVRKLSVGRERCLSRRISDDCKCRFRASTRLP